MPSRKATVSVLSGIHRLAWATCDTQRTEREARVWAKLKHKNIAPLLGFVYFTPALPSLVSVAYHCDLKSLVNKYKTGSAMGSGKVLTIEQKLLFVSSIMFSDCDQVSLMHIRSCGTSYWASSTVCSSFLVPLPKFQCIQAVHASGIAHGDMRAVRLHSYSIMQWHSQVTVLGKYIGNKRNVSRSQLLCSYQWLRYGGVLWKWHRLPVG